MQPNKKLPPPKVVEENGRRVAVFEFGKTDPAVKVGRLTFRLIPLVFANGRAEVGFDVENRSDDDVVIRDLLPNWDSPTFDGQDSTGKPLRNDGGNDTGPGGEPEWKLYVGTARRSLRRLMPLIDPKATAVTVTVPAPPNDAADLWRVTYPKRTWLPARDGFEPKLKARRS